MLLTRVRIDTIDLQDQLAPSAQDHSRKPLQTDGFGHGYHQASELRHVQHERAVEEVALTNSWTNVSGLSEEPPSEDDEMFANGDHLDDHMLHQHGMDHDDEDSDMNPEDEDDDGADRISSSPSISDGSSSHFVWPRRISSLTPLPPSLERSGEEDAGASTTLSLARLPLPTPETLDCSNATPACRESRSSQDGEEVSTRQCRGSDDSACSSPFVMSPEHLPLSCSNSMLSIFGYHPLGESEYMHRSNVSPDLDSNLESDCPDHKGEEMLPLLKQPERTQESRSNPSRVSWPQISPSVMDLSELVMSDSELYFGNWQGKGGEIDKGVRFDQQSAHVPIDIDDILDDDSDEDWITDSEDDDASFNSLSFSEDVFKDLLAIHDLQLDASSSNRSLQTTEDIDFEFVYALHNFVATVEGQANATKGDTMVLLDDSNSYWWLVRIVKDSSIGMSFNFRGSTNNCRLSPGRTHRNAYGEAGKIKQAQKYRCTRPQLLKHLLTD
jgi:hypothetical protein